MKWTLCVPTSWKEEVLQQWVSQTSKQTHKPDKCIFLVHGKHKAECVQKIKSILRNWLTDLDVKVIVNGDEWYETGNWVAYDRQFLIDQVETPYFYMIDDDNVFSKDFFSDCLQEYRIIFHETQELQEWFYSPLIERRKTWMIQSWWIVKVRRFFPKFYFWKPEKWSEYICHKVAFIWANSFFWPTQIAQKIAFDPIFDKCAEDIDFSYRITKAGIPYVVSDTIRIHHMERDKTQLEKVFLEPYTTAYFRARNRIIFMKKNWTFREKVQYFGCWLRVQTLWFFLYALWYPSQSKREIVKSITRGTCDGLRGNY